ncbi:PhzF family phenazine biosynthesis protein [Pseudoxanthomonas sp. Root630]|uniref:PhzF family phenazine biosynthesis protein n=1 Tax=Pseudoxanthomonas sp. Root630 TaxID=1736574 RepID=UPI00070363E9|nr:PhzF family phenazine biosynthesis protein [Pseudoxanthomonas sp. Root630]KRA51759.1 phenazine biosynthesis protein [Pseudoxanthomonas sp. Root630]
MQRTTHRYLQVDVFADRPGAGNPLGVVLDAAAWDTERMQAFAGWTNLSETIFFLPPTTPDASYRIRIFTPRQELPFAGHPSVGAAWVALHTGLIPASDRLVQECAAGLLPVRVEGDGLQRTIHLRAPRAYPMEVTPDPPERDTTLASLPTAGLPAALWNNGPAWWLVELRDAAAVRALEPDLPAIAALTQATGAIGLAVFGRASAQDDHDLAVRAFCPADNIPEDPVTGSVNACIAAALTAAGVLPGTAGRYLASQGRELGRDGRVHLEVDGEDEVWIGGQVQWVIDGQVTW